MSKKRLMKAQNEQMIFGVAAGIADYLNIDPAIVRLLFVLMALTGGHGLLIYLILAVVMPEDAEPVGKANYFDEEEIVIQDA